MSSWNYPRLPIFEILTIGMLTSDRRSIFVVSLCQFFLGACAHLLFGNTWRTHHSLGSGAVQKHETIQINQDHLEVLNSFNFFCFPTSVCVVAIFCIFCCFLFSLFPLQFGCLFDKRGGFPISKPSYQQSFIKHSLL